MQYQYVFEKNEKNSLNSSAAEKICLKKRVFCDIFIKSEYKQIKTRFRERNVSWITSKKLP